jgi:hypothetical protein
MAKIFPFTLSAFDPNLPPRSPAFAAASDFAAGASRGLPANAATTSSNRGSS